MVESPNQFTRAWCSPNHRCSHQWCLREIEPARAIGSQELSATFCSLRCIEAFPVFGLDRNAYVCVDQRFGMLKVFPMKAGGQNRMASGQLVKGGLKRGYVQFFLEDQMQLFDVEARRIPALFAD